MGVKYADVIERMRWAGKLKNDSAVARVVGVTPQALSSCKKRGEMPSDLVLKFSNIFSLSLDWLLTGEGAMHKWPKETDGLHGVRAMEASTAGEPGLQGAKGVFGFTVMNTEEIQYVNRLLNILRSEKKEDAAAIRSAIDVFFKSTEESASA
ncbi:MAG: helix-turn-helix domain-containing protein [Deltaproteobacteria bacterium]|nr:helix-turn-helix domain-containing protein [Deltaproteobacteria bacterium]